MVTNDELYAEIQCLRDMIKRLQLQVTVLRRERDAAFEQMIRKNHVKSNPNRGANNYGVVGNPQWSGQPIATDYGQPGIWPADDADPDDPDNYESFVDV